MSASCQKLFIKCARTRICVHVFIQRALGQIQNPLAVLNHTINQSELSSAAGVECYEHFDSRSEPLGCACDNRTPNRKMLGISAFQVECLITLGSLPLLISLSPPAIIGEHYNKMKNSPEKGTKKKSPFKKQYISTIMFPMQSYPFSIFI